MTDTKKAAQESSPESSHFEFSTTANGLLQPRVQTDVKQQLAAQFGWKSVGLMPTKGRRAIRRSLKKIGIPLDQIETMVEAMGLEVRP